MKEERARSLMLLLLIENATALQLGVDQSTISRDIKVLKESAQQFVYDLTKSDLAY
jgi:hypothetical protein